MWQSGQRSPLKNIANVQNGLPIVGKPQACVKNLQIVRRLVAIPQNVKFASGPCGPTTPRPSSSQPQRPDLTLRYRTNSTPRQDPNLIQVRERFKEIQNSVPQALPVLEDSDYELSDEDFIPKKKKCSTSCSLNQSLSNESFTVEKQARKKANCRKTDKERNKIIEALEEKSRSREDFQRIHEILPQTFEYIMTSLEENDLEWQVLLRANINTKEEAELWLEEYQCNTSCDFRIRDNIKENKRHKWKKVYRCHFNVPQPNKTQPTDDSKKKIKRLSKNIDCPANMRISILNKDMKWSGDDLLQKYPCEITIHHCHNHFVDSKEALRRRRPTKEIEQKFIEMFQNGHHSPSSAVATHKMNLQSELGDDYFITAADRSKCPDVKWASRLYYKIFKKFYGASDLEEMLESLQIYIKQFNDKEGSICASSQTLNDKDTIVAVCTPLMKRVHEKLESAGEVNFVDSSGTMDRQNHRVFLILCPSIAGGLPLGVIITSSEAEEVLKEGFKLLNTLVPGSQAFSGRGLIGPKIIFTDDSAAERNALQFTFPEAELLLCIFHVLQAFWRYVWNSDHKVDKKFRSDVYFAFHEAVYAGDVETFEARFTDLLEMPSVSGNATLQKHLNELKMRAKEWALSFRCGLLTRGHTTNNYAEAGMLQLKSTVLHRLKAFNLVQLLDFVVAGFMGHLERRLVDVINDRALNIQRSKYYVDPEKLTHLKCSKLTIPNFYVVKNESKGTEYVVNMKEEICSCPMGQCGATCKHQCAIVKEFNVRSTQILSFVDNSVKQELLYIVYGSSVTVPSHWFAKLTDKPTAQVEVQEDSRETTDEMPNFNDEEVLSTPSDTQIETSGRSTVDTLSSDEIDKVSNDLYDMVNSWVLKLKERPEVYGKACENIIKQSHLMGKHDSALTSAMFMFGKAQGGRALQSSAKGILARAVKYSRNIPVNSTSRSRRKTYLGGRNVQLTGRPPNSLHQKVPEHNFCTPVSSRATGPAWHRLPKGRAAAPHSLDFCVSRKQSLGRTHHKK